MAADASPSPSSVEDPAVLDHRALRYAAYAALGLHAIWYAAAELLGRAWEPLGHSFSRYQHLLLWCALAIAAVYYGRAMAKGMRPPRNVWMLSIALVILPAGLVWAGSGWDAALTVALALAAWIPFSVTWIVPVLGFLNIRGKLAKTGVALICCAAPAAWMALMAGAELVNLADAETDAAWRAAGLAAAVGSLLLIGAALFLTGRARRAAAH